MRPFACQERPKITGISHLAVYTSDAAATDHYYREMVGAAKEPDPENPQGVRYAFSATQFIEVLPLPPNAGVNRLDHAAFNTVSAEGMRKYLAAKGWKTPDKVEKGSDGSRWFTVLDPEGNKVEFVQPPANAKAPDAPNVIGHHIIHVGFLVHGPGQGRHVLSRPARLQAVLVWRDESGRQDRLGEPAGSRRARLAGVHADERTVGVGDSGEYLAAPAGRAWIICRLAKCQWTMAYKTLKDGGRLEGVKNDGHTQIGKDGKGQFNLYDPDGIRLELMNFHATEKPCCSPFTAEDPAE